MMQIFFDMQGNAQLADAYLISVAMDQPEAFGLAEISEEDYNERVLKGHKYIKGAFVAPKAEKEKDLSDREEKALLKKHYEDNIKSFKDKIAIALLEGDASVIKKTQADFKAFKDEFHALMAIAYPDVKIDEETGTTETPEAKAPVVTAEPKEEVKEEVKLIPAPEIKEEVKEEQAEEPKEAEPEEPTKEETEEETGATEEVEPEAPETEEVEEPEGADVDE